MIEKMRGRSTETKYGRIPLWLYGAGVSLQAIATYGWLHGRYGHFEKVIPSYATLARELKVSRGSVIAYVKELTGAGAVRIVTSGAAGQTTNTYEIAFNEPFSVDDAQVGDGQNADQVVSGLYRSGQPADGGGQRAVQEEDVPKKTKKTFSPRPSRKSQPPPSPEPAAEAPERETEAAPDNHDQAQQVAAAWEAARGGRPVPSARRQVAATAGELLAAGWPLEDLVALAEDMARVQPAWRDLSQHAGHWQPPQRERPTLVLPEWCGQCDGPALAQRWVTRPDGAGRCSRCHPHAGTRSASTAA